MKRNYLLIFGFILCSIGTQAQVKNNKNKETKGVSIIDNTRPYSGYFDFYYSPKSDKIYLKVSNTEEEFLYVNSLSQGIGNNDIGLDRGNRWSGESFDRRRSYQSIIIHLPIIIQDVFGRFSSDSLTHVSSFR